jgi:hypothetical protein
MLSSISGGKDMTVAQANVSQQLCRWSFICSAPESDYPNALPFSGVIHPHKASFV